MTTLPATLLYTPGKLKILDQTVLPFETNYLTATTVQDVYEAIRKLQVRGAPAIGLAGGYGLALSAGQTYQNVEEAKQQLRVDAAYLITARPTAVNLATIVNAIVAVAHNATTLNDLRSVVENEIKRLHEADVTQGYAIGEHALQVLGTKRKVMTICNAGAIATAKYGTALAPFHLGKERGIDFSVVACETRPLLQGARLTVWELQQAGIDVTLITDNMAAYALATQHIEAVIVGADRIAQNGDTANKIGTLGLAIVAKAYGIPFYIAAPSTTFDFTCATGDDIEIEQRATEEVTTVLGKAIAAPTTSVLNPAFDVTPAAYITAIITEKGVLQAPYTTSIKQFEEELV